jgi:hypothetical protein
MGDTGVAAVVSLSTVVDRSGVAPVAAAPGAATCVWRGPWSGL